MTAGAGMPGGPRPHGTTSALTRAPTGGFRSRRTRCAGTRDTDRWPPAARGGHRASAPSWARGNPGRSRFRLRHDADVGTRRLPAIRIDLLRLVIRDRARDDDVVA